LFPIGNIFIDISVLSFFDGDFTHTCICLLHIITCITHFVKHVFITYDMT